ncbi:hypothetical protein DH2020_007729 [Rehmannia glutinosa]|uniref:RNase H type-1 domain-containing protein n=1 Tax=Rehmannia glutinosa TaxID=99300 RepID=A0ABR0TYY8_REHGL
MGMTRVSSHGKYLGLPSVIDKSEKEVFASIKDKIWAKLQGWKERHLSQAGKEILIKSIIQSIPTFAMSCFKLPDIILDDIQKMATNYWWGSSSDKKKLHWVSWDNLSIDKSRGGLGFRNFRAFNLSMLSKQAWRLLTNPSSLLSWVFKAKYYPNCDFMAASLGSRSSWSWRSILDTKPLLRLGARRLYPIGEIHTHLPAIATTADNLARRGIQDTNPVRFVLAEKLRNPHLLLSRPFSKAVWQHAGLLPLLEKFQQPSWRLWLQDLLLFQGDFPIELTAILCSLIWYHRNRYKFEALLPEPYILVTSASNMLRDFNDAQPERISPQLLSHPLFGESSNCPKIYFDGAISPSRRCAGLGIALLDEQESLVVARNLNLPHLAVFGDAASVIITAQGDSSCPIDCQAIFEEISRFKQSFSHLCFFWIRRPLNSLAYNLAFYAKQYKMKVLIDLHAVEGSQNGNDHSGSRDGFQEWGASYIPHTVAVIDFLAKRLGAASNTELLPLAKGLSRSVIDVHYYNLYSDMFSNMNAQQNIDYIYNQRAKALQQVTPTNGPLSFVDQDPDYTVHVGQRLEISPGSTKYWIPEVEQEKIPRANMHFRTLEAGIQFYKDYGLCSGFDVRRSTTKNKGSGSHLKSRLQSQREKAIKASTKLKRKCGTCGKVATHNSRTCPTRTSTP